MKKSFLAFVFMMVIAGIICLSSVAVADFEWRKINNIYGGREYSAIASSADGVKLVTCERDGYIYMSSDAGASWTGHTDIGKRFWRAVTSSADGTKLAACVYNRNSYGYDYRIGYIYISTNSGATWTEQIEAGKRQWSSITSSVDGTKLVACVNGGYIYTSVDYGETWTEQPDAGVRHWESITSSADGTKLAACVSGGYIYTSTDSGATWIEQTDAGERDWSSIVSSADGTKLAACVGKYMYTTGYIYTSIDSGATWTEQTDAGERNWVSIDSSEDCTKLAACVRNGYIYTSVDSGVTWTEQTNTGEGKWNCIALSSDGTKLSSCNNDYIYTSIDSGVIWQQRKTPGPRKWNAIALSVDGRKLVACENDGYIYTSADSGASWTEQVDFGKRYWELIASSADGTKLAAFIRSAYEYGYIYTSVDSGVTWKKETDAGHREWRSISLSPNGANLVACEHSGYICTSPDLGETWSTQKLGGDWSAIASSVDGSKLAVCEFDGYVYTSQDSGETWTEQTDAGERRWGSITSSADGTKLAACVHRYSVYDKNDYIYMSTDSGWTWTEQITLGKRNWSDISSSENGTKLAVCEYNGFIYTSKDSGITWTEQTFLGKKPWGSISFSGNGKKILACVYDGYIYIGEDDDWNEDDNDNNQQEDNRGPRLQANANTSWYLAEGCTAGFDQWVCIMNPNAEDAFVTVTFMKPDGSTVAQDITVKATSRYTIHANSVVPNESISTKMESTNDVGIIAERAMYWNVGEDTWAGGHNCCGVKAPAPVWYLAEGCTAGFDEWIPIMNPSSEDAEVTVTFMKPDGSTVARDIIVKATSRYTIAVNGIVPNESVSTKVESTNGVGIIAERAMYWNAGDMIWVDGHCSAGVTTSDIIWYLAEGCTAGFDEWVLIMNPNDSNAQVKVTFMKPDGSTVENEMIVKATSRTSINVNGIVPNESVSTKVESLNDVGIIAERAMYWDAGNIPWAGGHNSNGVTASANTWYLAEGCTAGFDEWVLIMNPNSVDADVAVTFMKPDGSTISHDLMVKATSRSSICANNHVLNESISAKIESRNDVGVIAERAMYWNVGDISWGGGHNASGTIGCAKLRVQNRESNVGDGATTISIVGTQQIGYSSPFWVGDDFRRSGEIGRGFIGFDISDIPSIFSAKLRLYQESVIGEPFNNLGGAVLVDHVDFGSSADANDYNATALSRAGVISRSIRQGWREIDVTRQVKKDLTAGRSRSQFKLYFANGTNEDGNTDAVIFEDSANSRGTGNKPELVIEY